MLIELTPGKGFIIMANANVQTAANDQEVSSVQFLTVTAIFVALTYIFTAFINVRLQSQQMEDSFTSATFLCSSVRSSLARKPEQSQVVSEWDCLTCSPDGLYGLHLLS